MKKIFIYLSLFCLLILPVTASADGDGFFGGGGCTIFSCLAGIPSTIAGYGLTGVVQPYNSYLTGINQDVSTAGSPSWVGATVGAGGITATKQNGVAGLITVYNAATTSTLYMGWMGSATLSRSYAFQFPSTEPTAGQVMAFGVPGGAGDPNNNPISAITWITPLVSGGALGTPASGNLSGCSGYPADATKANVPTVTVNSGSIGSLTGTTNYVICTGACNFTPPAGAAGNRVCVRNAPNSTGAITINALASTYYEKHDYSNWNTVNKNLSSGGAQTDSICLFGYDNTHYIILNQVGTWTDGS